MVITCSRCKTQYNLDQTQINVLYRSTLRCQGCQNYIKIAQCPSCHTFYTISISAPQKNDYTVKCLKCSQQFSLNFSVEQQAQEQASAESGVTPGNESRIPEEGAEDRFERTDEKQSSRDREIENRENDRDRDVGRDEKKQFRPLKKETRENEFEESGSPARKEPLADKQREASSMSISNLLQLASGSLTRNKIFAGGIGVAAAYLFVSIFNLAANSMAFFVSIPSQVRNLLSLFPPGLIIFCYMWTSIVISRITINELVEKRMEGFPAVLKLFGKYFIAVLSVNLVILIILSFIFTAFGGLPIAGPILFSLMFLILYLVSAAVFVILLIGVWFYPSLAVLNNGDTRSSLEGFKRFILKYNFRLGYIIPLLMIISSIAFLGLYALHFGSLYLVQFISKNMLGESAVKIFSSIPGFFQQTGWASLFGADMSLFKSLAEGVMISHSIGGFLLGIIFTILAWFLLSALFSILSTLSARVYLMLERGLALEDSIGLKVAATLLMILSCIFLLKKIFF